MKIQKRKIWQPAEDEILKNILQKHQKPYPWKEIAKEMKLKYGVIGKNFKDCRERYQEYSPLIWNYIRWTDEQERLLIQKQDQTGNKWFQISHFFPGRKDVFLKNQFYSIFRKALKKANVSIYQYCNNKVRPITKALILKTLMVCESRFNKKRQYPQTLLRVAIELKHTLIDFLFSTFSQEEWTAHVQRFLKAVIEFRKRMKNNTLDFNKQEQIEMKEADKANHQHKLGNQFIKIAEIPIQFQHQARENKLQFLQKQKTDLTSCSYFQNIVCKVRELNQITVQQISNELPILNLPVSSPNLRNPNQLDLSQQLVYPLQSFSRTYQNYVQNPYNFKYPYVFNNQPLLDWRQIYPGFY